MQSIEAARKTAKQMLSPRRYRHTKNVAKAARALALRWGADANKAELAAWLHDVVKETPREGLLQLLHQDAIMAKSTESRPFPVWHGPCGAIFARHKLGVADEEVLSAIDCHTTGKEEMGLLDKIIFLADAISEERHYRGIEETRRLAYENLDAAVVAAMRENLDYLKAKGKPLDAETQKALAYMHQQLEANI